MIGVCRLRNRIQEYAWGSRSFIPTLLGEQSPSHHPQAELWMGAHPKAPSAVVLGGHDVSLPDFLATHAHEILGRRVLDRLGAKLPFLFKVIAAEEPLSIQAHPNLKQARQGFEREEKNGIPINAFDRNYRDRNHKPEVVVALTEFWALNGFRPVEELIDAFERIGAEELVITLRSPDTGEESKALLEFLRMYLVLDSEKKSTIIEAALKYSRSMNPNEKDAKWTWIETLYEKARHDSGVLAPLFLNLVCLKPGEGQFLEAGVLHAYLRGAAVELMANSDNVLRCGLTQKHVDVTELLRVVNPQSKVPVNVAVQKINLCERLYITTAVEFQLSQISVDIDNSFVSQSDRCVEILLCVEGEGEIAEYTHGQTVGNSCCEIFCETFSTGHVFLIPASADQYRIRGRARLYKATVPLG